MRTELRETEAIAANDRFAQALKEYFVELSRHVAQEDFVVSRLSSSDCDVDFVARVPRERVDAVTETLIGTAYEVYLKFGVHLSTMVLPK